MTLASANRRTSRSLAVNPPSLKTGCENGFVVAVVTTSPVSARALRNAEIRSSRSSLVSSNPNTSLSWKFTPYAPSSASLRTARSAGISGRTAPPNTSTPCQPTVQIPNENLSSRLGTYASAVTSQSSPLQTPLLPARWSLFPDRRLPARGIPVLRRLTEPRQPLADHRLGRPGVILPPAARPPAGLRGNREEPRGLAGRAPPDLLRLRPH